MSFVVYLGSEDTCIGISIWDLDGHCASEYIGDLEEIFVYLASVNSRLDIECE